MNAHKSKAKRKRQHDGNDDDDGPRAQQNIQQLLAESQPSISSVDQPMKITGLIDDCLLEIFDYLDLVSLFNVAVANERLRPAAGMVYKRKFGAKEVWIRSNKNDRSCSVPFEEYGRMKISDLKMALQFLRCLGSSINHLSIFHNGFNETQAHHINQYLIEYCTESLTSIELWDKHNGISIEHFEKPFINARTVLFHRCYLKKQFPLLPQRFPNMRSLELFNVEIGRCYIDSPFNHLEDLLIEITSGKRGFTMMNAKRFLQLCPQLLNLKINVLTDSGNTPNQIANIIEDNPKICNLNVENIGYKKRVIPSDIQRLLDEHLSLVELEFPYNIFAVDTVILVLRQLKSLKLFTFEMASRSEYDRILSQLDSQWQPWISDFLFGSATVKLTR